MAKEIEGLRVAVLATDGFEQTELTEPVKALHHLDVQVDVVSPRSGQIQGMQHKVRVDRTLDAAHAGDYAGLVLPGGVANPDELRIDARAVRFVRQLSRVHREVSSISGSVTRLASAGSRDARRHRRG